MEDIFALCDTIRRTGLSVRSFFRHGHLEKVHENALLHRLRRVGCDVRQQVPLYVADEDGTLVGQYVADLFVEGRLIVEVKASKAIAPEHVAQILGYLRAARVEHGLLVNFGAPVFQTRKFILTR